MCGPPNWVRRVIISEPSFNSTTEASMAPRLGRSMSEDRFQLCPLSSL